MGVEARFQAVPEDWEWLIKARENREIAESLADIDSYIRRGRNRPGYDSKSLSGQVVDAVIELGAKRPGLAERYFYAGGRTFDIIIYLLSPKRRANQPDDSLIRKVFYGYEPLHPDARASQGIPIGFVSSANVVQVSDYLVKITKDELRQHWNPDEMSHVYKFGPDKFQWVWEEFVGMRDVYTGAKEHGEAVITVID